MVPAAVEVPTRGQTKVRFIIAGGVNTVFGLAVYPILYYGLSSFNLHYEVILLLAQSASILFAFATSKLFVFRTKGNVWAEFLKFSVFHVANIVVNILALPLLVDGLKIHPVLAQVGFAAIVILSSYFWHSRISFKRSPLEK